MLLLTIWPVFALICLGTILARSGFPGDGFWPTAERLTYSLLFPALLVASLADAPVRDPALLRLGGAAAINVTIAAAAVMAVRHFAPMPPARFGPILQGVIRFNTYLGLAIVAALTGDEGLSRAAVVLAVNVPLVNVLSILALTPRRTRRSAVALIPPVVNNPLILACALGLTLALTGIGLPFGLDRLLGFLGQASLPLGLLCVGAALRLEALKGDASILATVGAVRLLAMPALAAGVAWACGVTGTEALVLIVFAAIPTATTAYVLTRQLGGDGALMAGLITSQTLASVVTLPLVLALFAL